MQQQRFCFFGSKIGKKYLVALTGLGLSFFVLSHMLGNMLILVSPQAYNNYGHALISNPFIYLAELGLVGLFVVHMALAMKLTRENWKARPVPYAVTATGDKSTSLTTRSMWAQGILLLVFTIHHLITFKYGPHYEVDYGGTIIRDLHRLVVETFQDPLYVGWYLICLLALGFHLSHGVSSSIQTLGIYHPRHFCKFKALGFLYAVLVVLGFVSQPLYVFFIYKG
ncbi:MAG: succinate dehydrogenase cytochrome b subunit [Bdellovibrionaceae bacterium]|nr:succinate dehydrogenase cytochrome b subunit [Bdellovibrionales bacterium]MCB9085434.1 succinate dehydrogenase cytochrome b subunit [Pseudobdellovibrionaceae bacterium]